MLCRYDRAVKRCSSCEETKPLDAFSPARRSRPSAQCRQCETETRKRYKETAEQRERKLAYLRSWKAEHPDYQRNWHAERPTYQREWRAKHPDAAAKYSRRWRMRDPHRAKARDRRFALAHPERFAQKSAKRRALKARALGRHTLTEWNLIVKKQRHRCAHCGMRRKLTRDHIIPISRGGSGYAFNIQGLCKSCNSTKNARVEAGAQYSLFDQLDKHKESA